MGGWLAGWLDGWLGAMGRHAIRWHGIASTERGWLAAIHPVKGLCWPALVATAPTDTCCWLHAGPGIGGSIKELWKKKE